jgi:hypothetical protein
MGGDEHGYDWSKYNLTYYLKSKIDDSIFDFVPAQQEDKKKKKKKKTLCTNCSVLVFFEFFFFFLVLF